ESACTLYSSALCFCVLRQTGIILAPGGIEYEFVNSLTLFNLDGGGLVPPRMFAAHCSGSFRSTQTRLWHPVLPVGWRPLPADDRLADIAPYRQPRSCAHVVAIPTTRRTVGHFENSMSPCGLETESRRTSPIFQS